VAASTGTGDKIAGVTSYNAGMTTLRVAVLVCWAAAGTCVSAAELTPDQWRADVAFLAKELPQRHKNLYHTLSRAEFQRMVDELSADIPKLSEVEIRGRIARILAAIGDGHTWADIASDRYFDLGFQQFPEGLFVVSSVKRYEDALGAQVMAIDGTPVEEVRKRLSQYAPAENQYSAIAYAGSVQNPAALRASGITRSVERAEFLLQKGGRSFSLTVTARPVKSRRPAGVPTPFTPPLSLRRADENYWYEYLADGKALYIQYNSCAEVRNLPFQKFTAQVLETALRETPEKLVIDVRHNGGGNSEILNPLLEAMASNAVLRPSGGVYVLSGPDTFSSGLMAAMRLRTRFQAMVAGEPTRERLNHYGNMGTFNLPNSGIQVAYSTRYFIQAEGDPETLEPELLVPLTASDYFAGRDAVLEAVLHLPSSVETNYRDAIAKNPRLERAYLALSQLLQGQKRIADAETVLRAGVAANPHAAELRMALAGHFVELKKFGEARAVLAGDSGSGVLYELGQVYQAEGKLKQAMDAYRKCYRAEPLNSRGLRAVAEVYLAQHKPDEAIRALDEEAERNPGNFEIRLYAGNVASRAGRTDAQIAEYRTLIAELRQRSEDAFYVWLQLSDVYRKNGKAAEAIRAFQSACSGGEEIEAFLAGYYERALQGEPGDAVLMSNLSFLLAATGRDAERALTLARRAKELLPKVAEVADNLGMVYIARKDWEPAVALFRELVTKAPEGPLWHYHLAQALRGSGDRDGAIRELREALRLGPAEEDKPATQALLDSLVK